MNGFDIRRLYFAVGYKNEGQKKKQQLIYYHEVARLLSRHVFICDS